MVKKSQKNPNHALLIAGGKDFLNASTAISKFGDLIFGTAEKVLKKRASELMEAMSLTLNANKITAIPKEGYVESGLDGTDAQIGVWAPLGNGHSFSLYVWWRIDDEQQEVRSIVAELQCKNRDSADVVERAPKSNVGSAIMREGNFFWIEKVIGPQEFVKIVHHFDAVVDRWIKWSKAIGGLKKHLKS